MIYSRYFSIILLALAISACHSTSKKNSEESDSKVKSIILTDSVRNNLIIKGSSISKQLAVVLQKNLKVAIKNEGFDYAIDFCHNRAMILTDSVSRALGVNIKRVAKKYRNPFNETTQQESNLYKQYIIDWLGNIPQKPQIIPDSEGNPVFYSLIKLNKKVCLNCHGTPGKELPFKREMKIKKYYPGDLAIDFELGQPRGMWVITFPNYKIADSDR